MVVKLVLIGMEINVLHVQEVEYGIHSIVHVIVKILTGMDLPVSDVHQDKVGIKQVYHVHVHLAYFGMVSNVDHVQDKEHGISN